MSWSISGAPSVKFLERPSRSNRAIGALSVNSAYDRRHLSSLRLRRINVDLRRAALQDFISGAIAAVSHAQVEDAVTASHKALAAIINGDASPWFELYSEMDDISIGNPFGPFAVGRTAMVEAGSRAASHYTDGRIHGFDRIGTHISGELACVVEVERFEVRLDRAPALTSLSFRATSLYRLEAGGWKLVHRHADPINAVRTAASLAAS